jgi:hypothetical protein
MGDNAEQVERHIEERRNHLSKDLSELERKAKEAVDWRAQVDQRPGTMLGIAFGAGIILSAIFGGGGSRRSRSRRIDERGAQEPISPLKAYSSDSNADYQDEMARGEDRRGSAVNQTFENVKGALMGVAIAKCEDFLEEVLPGFGAQYRKVEARNKAGMPSSDGTIN